MEGTADDNSTLPLFRSLLGDEVAAALLNVAGRASLRGGIQSEAAAGTEATATKGGPQMQMDPVTIFAMVVIGLLLLCCCAIACYFCVWKRLAACFSNCTNCCVECKPRCRRCCQDCSWKAWYPL